MSDRNINNYLIMMEAAKSSKERDEEDPNIDGDEEYVQSFADDNNDDDDISVFGSDDSDVHNDFDPEEISVINSLIASESSAIGEYLDAAKNTNVDILRRLYSDIGDEERFHSEQLMFAKASLTGEKYEPRDPDVKREYEELLALGMDEETAMTTAIDKTNFTGTNVNVDDDAFEELKETVATLESAMLQCSTSIDLMSYILESGDFNSEELDKNMDIFSESFMYVMEDANDPVHMSGFENPLKIIWGGYLAFLNLLKKLLKRFAIFINKWRIRNKNTRMWIRKHGIKGIFSHGISLYFYSDDNLDNISTKPIVYANMLARLTSDVGRSVGLNLPEININTVPNPIKYRNIEDGMSIANNVVLSKTKIIVNDKNESVLMEKFFGTENGGKRTIYDDYQLIADMLGKVSEYCGSVLQEMMKFADQPNSIYYTDRNKYNKATSQMNNINKCFKTFANAVAHDMNVIMKLHTKVEEMGRNNNNNDTSSTEVK